jgi:hypothetical protein
MQYVNKAWRPLGVEEITLTRETRPGCVGANCALRPDHIVIFGADTALHACFRHVHGLLKFAEQSAGHAMVSPYMGV